MTTSPSQAWISGNLLGGLEHGWIMTFHSFPYIGLLGSSSSQLMNSMIFQRARYTTNQLNMVIHGNSGAIADMFFLFLPRSPGCFDFFPALKNRMTPQVTMAWMGGPPDLNPQQYLAAICSY